jgi:hypothetical protein
MSSSESNTRAGPENRRPSLPVILPTAPPGARLPRRIEMWPRDFTAVSTGAMMVWPSVSGAASATFSPRVRPVTVIWSPSM